MDIAGATVADRTGPRAAIRDDPEALRVSRLQYRVLRWCSRRARLQLGLVPWSRRRTRNNRCRRRPGIPGHRDEGRTKRPYRSVRSGYQTVESRAPIAPALA